MAIAAFWGTTAGYNEYHNDKIVVEHAEGRVAVVNRDTFDYLYYRLNEFTAALKEDCIHYIIHDPDKCLFEYPEWFVDACSDGIIFEDDWHSCILYEESGDIAVAPNSMILRNYKGELKHLEAYKFHQYYDTLEE